MYSKRFIRVVHWKLYVYTCVLMCTCVPVYERKPKCLTTDG